MSESTAHKCGLFEILFGRKIPEYYTQKYDVLQQVSRPIPIENYIHSITSPNLLNETSGVAVKPEALHRGVCEPFAYLHEFLTYRRELL